MPSFHCHISVFTPETLPLQVVPNMHMGVDSSSVPGLRVPSGFTKGSDRAMKRRLPEEMSDRTQARLLQYRIQVVKQVPSTTALPTHTRILLHLLHRPRSPLSQPLPVLPAPCLAPAPPSELHVPHPAMTVCLLRPCRFRAYTSVHSLFGLNSLLPSGRILSIV